MISEPLEEAYFQWLCSHVVQTQNTTPSTSYWHLLKQLHSTEFVWVVIGDDNRAQDGVDLRYQFLNLVRESEQSFLNQPCSFLEMLIGLAHSISFNIGEELSDWFWKMLDNIGLAFLNDAQPYPEHKVAEIVNSVIWRTYDGNGYGGLFPLSRTKHDQRKVELWYQFCEYQIDQEP